MTQHAKSLFGSHEAAPSLRLQGASVGKKASPPAVDGPPVFQVAAPLSAVAAVDGPSVSTSLPLAGDAKQAGVSNASMSATEWEQCLSIVWGDANTKTKGFLATQFGRRLTTSAPTKGFMQKCLTRVSAIVTLLSAIGNALSPSNTTVATQPPINCSLAADYDNHTSCHSMFIHWENRVLVAFCVILTIIAACLSTILAVSTQRAMKRRRAEALMKETNAASIL
eukprot:GHVT01038466.1.p1 GENE.GHVT01038466.1~~GHVT01038466.1.p1  ORF type:complete len:247 (+),score=34.38 GHVT01038466.1:71-742(+)